MIKLKRLIDLIISFLPFIKYNVWNGEEQNIWLDLDRIWQT